MKFITKNTLLAALLSAASVGAFAAGSVDLQVIGTITPASCTPTLSGGGIIDLGTISGGTIAANAFTNLGTHSSALTITCDQPARVAVHVVDDRTSSVVPGIASTLVAGLTDADAFGLGTVGTANVGSYTLGFSDPTADGTAGSGAISLDNGTTWAVATDANRNLNTNKLATASDANGVPKAFTTMTTNLNAVIGINKRSALPATQDVPLDGLATISMVYL
ncbi:DUF1120 domain-containing protein [Paraburkholderia sartisoli]|uniref:DUF1120 domain-containing protein n=1 Tax=Paraburkholderia sartisoli TaxID=83784 RepID=A0A1H4G4S4_9BURK|nr:DUF1120 domain-containing protein [Paraburkholderia sartisoli]SEB04291.1 Protein of unknown function [Paraburkholderia sartisoli]